MSEALTPVIIPVEEQITQELVKGNVTDTIIANLREKYLPLKIKGIDDKEGYLEVKEARKECKSIRVLAEKICKKGREEALAIQKAWIGKEKEVTGKISEVEDYLEKQEKEYEAEIEKIKADKKRKQEEQFINRQAILNGMGSLYSDGNFILGDVSFEMSLIKECDDDIWEQTILPKFKAQFDIIDAERKKAEDERLAKEAELKRQQEEIERKAQELKDREDSLRKSEEEAERVAEKNREDERRKIREELDAKNKRRTDQLYGLGLKFDFNADAFVNYNCAVASLDITVSTDKEWAIIIENLTTHIAKYKEQEEKDRLSKIEEEKRIAMEDAAKAERKKIEEEQAAAELRRQQEEQRKADEMAQAKDKEKWEDILRQLNAITLHEMKSGPFRKKVTILREKIEEINEL